MKKLINYLNESKITIIVLFITLLVAILGTKEIWTTSEYSNGVNVFLNMFAIVPFLSICVGIYKGVKND